MNNSAKLFRFALLLSVIFLISCNNYGDKVSKDYLEVYYKDGATEEEAQKTLELLHPVWKNQEGGADEKKSVQLTRSADTINFRMVTNPEKVGSISDDIFYQMANEFSTSLYNGAPVNVILTDNKFKEIRNLRFREMGE